MKGDFKEFLNGIDTISSLKDGDKILIMEACSHNPVCNDIGREQIPNGIKKLTKKNIRFDVKVGHDFPKDLIRYKLIIHCGACILNRKEVLSRINEAKSQCVPITNYGTTLSHISGDLKRAIEFVTRNPKKD
jgi:predicted GTPase